jgi:hypothetical protein
MMPTDVDSKFIAQVVQSISTQTQMMIMRDGTNNPFNTVFLTLAASGGALEITAALVGKRVGSDPVNCITDQSLLFASLLAAVSLRRVDHKVGKTNAGHLSTDFGPGQMIEAMDWFEKLTGEKPDKYLDDGLVAVMAQYRKDAETPLGDFLSKRPRPPTDRTTLN